MKTNKKIYFVNNIMYKITLREPELLCKICYMWVPLHSGIERNEEVNKAANETNPQNYININILSTDAKSMSHVRLTPNGLPNEKRRPTTNLRK